MRPLQLASIDRGMRKQLRVVFSGLGWFRRGAEGGRPAGREGPEHGGTGEHG